jgi:hypothetical protein
MAQSAFGDVGAVGSDRNVRLRASQRLRVIHRLREMGR